MTSCVLPGSLASGPTSFEVASPASQELYVFDANGTHQFTMSLVTGDYKYNFSYRFEEPQITFCPSKKKKTEKNHLWRFVVTLRPSSRSNEEDLTAVTDSSGNTLRIRRDTNRMPVRVVAPDNQVRRASVWSDPELERGSGNRY